MPCEDQEMICRRVNYSQKRMPASRIDATFVPILKKIRKKHYCTISSCSGTVIDHQAHASGFSTIPSKYVLHEHAIDHVKIVKNMNLNGYIVIKIMDIAEKDVKEVRRMFKEKFEFTFKEIEDIIDLSCTAINLFKKINRTCKNVGFFNYMFVFDKINMLSVIVEPIETKQKKTLSDEEIVARWNQFADDLPCIKN